VTSIGLDLDPDPYPSWFSFASMQQNEKKKQMCIQSQGVIPRPHAGWWSGLQISLDFGHGFSGDWVWTQFSNYGKFMDMTYLGRRD
jgi:hypothetical protein